MDRYLAEAMVAAGNASKMPEFYGLGSEVQRLSSTEAVTKTAATCTCLAHCIVLTLSFSFNACLSD